MLIKVKVFPNSKKRAVVKKAKDGFDIKVKSKPIRGEANKEMLGLLAAYFKLPVGKLKIIRGSHQRNKMIKVNCQTDWLD